MLDREESIGHIFRYRIMRMALAICLAVLVQYSYNYYKNPLLGALNLKLFFRLVYEGSVAGQHWFFYAYISFLLLLPFLQRLVKVIPDMFFLYIFIVQEVINSIFPIMGYHLGWSATQLALPMEGIVVCSMIGYFLEHRCKDSFYCKKNILSMLGGTTLVILMHMYQSNLSLQQSQDMMFLGCFSITYAVSVFVLVKYICQRWHMSSLLQKIFCFAGAGVFGTYLLDGVIRDVLIPIYLYLNTRIYSYPAVFVWITVSALIGIVIANLFKRIPVIGKII